MSTATPSQNRRSLLLPLLLLLLGLAVIIGRAVWTDRATLGLTRSAIPQNTLSDIPEPRFFTSPDSYAWLCHARDMLRAGDWRIRHTHMDNAPHGRPMYWSHLLIWQLAAHARLLRALSTSPLTVSRAIELAGRAAMPFWTILALVPATLVLNRKWGFLPAAGFLLTTVSFPFLTESQSALAPDHHLLQQILVASTLAALTFGGWGHVRSSAPSACTSPWLRPLRLPSLASARRWFLTAGVAHAVLLWVGGSVWLAAHCVLCAAALVALVAPGADAHHAPRLWLSFLAPSLPLSIAFYIIEYAPHFPGMRLEVNSPLHWLFLSGTIFALAALSSFLSNRRHSPASPPFSFHLPLFTLLSGLLLAAPLPLALLFGPDSWHALHDDAIRRLHASFINEFRPLAAQLAANPLFPVTVFRSCLIPLLLMPFLAFRPRVPQPLSSLRPLASASLLYAVLYGFQIRWGLLFAATLPFLAAALASALTACSPPRGRRLAGILLAVLAIDSSAALAQDAITLARWAAPGHCPAEWIRADALKRSALRLAVAFQGDDSAAIAGIPHDAPAIYYFAGIPSLASFYWENKPGWHNEAALFADMSPDASSARSLVSRLSISRLLVPANSTRLPDLYAALDANRPPTARDLSVRLALSPNAPNQLPSWLAPDPTLSAALSATNYYHPAPDTRFRFSLPILAFSPTPPSHLTPDIPPFPSSTNSFPSSSSSK